MLSVAQQEAGDEDVPIDEDIIQPRLTRSKVREAVATTMSPEKIVSVCVPGGYVAMVTPAPRPG